MLLYKESEDGLATAIRERAAALMLEMDIVMFADMELALEALDPTNAIDEERWIEFIELCNELSVPVETLRDYCNYAFKEASKPHAMDHIAHIMDGDYSHWGIENMLFQEE
jgi:hypothetical protein